jgi:hypothetical protein
MFKLLSTVCVFVVLGPPIELLQPAAAAAEPTWLITAKPDVAKVQRDGQIKLNVTIKNNSTANQTVEIAQNFWYATSDNPAIKFASWPARGGHGPVVVFKTMTLAPGESFNHDWSAQVSSDAKLGKCTFRVGIPLHRNQHAPDWSVPVTIEIVDNK